ncbi:MAG: von Willebrand factor type A domain-containing protein [Candidatus Sericytochromatia bacterium]
MQRLLLWILFLFSIGTLLVYISLPNFIGAQDRSSSRSRAKIYDYPKSLTPEANGVADKDARKFNTEAYSPIEENAFLPVMKKPLSTFSLDVDTASYSNLRRFLNQGMLPPKDAIRTEELVNYFDYDYPDPEEPEPIAMNTELSSCPWNREHKLLQVGLQGRRVQSTAFPTANLVFLLDVSGSMEDENKLPLVKQSLRMLFDRLRPQDTVAIVVYAGAAGLVLPATRGDQKAVLRRAIDQLEAGGATAGGEGIRLAYKIAQEQFIPGGNNRVIMATDGDFNIGPSSDAEMLRLIESRRRAGIYLTVLGYGMGNYKDSKLELLADKGNGNYAYVDNLKEARKVLVTEMGGTLLTIADDVKIQLEFNPAKVLEYRLIGYENRVLADANFEDDRKDAGEMGAGHSMTALYELVLVNGTAPGQHQMLYLTTEIKPQARTTSELLTIRLRYKLPGQSDSKLLSRAIPDKSLPLEKTSDNFRFAAAVAGFGLWLRDSEFKGQLNIKQIRELAKGARGPDSEDYRQEFLSLLETAEPLKQAQTRQG